MVQAEKSGNEANLKSLIQKMKALKEQAQKSGTTDEAAEAEATEETSSVVDAAAAAAAAAEPVAATLNMTEIINDAYLRTLSRYPSDEELQIAQTFIAETADPVEGIRDVLWALLNTREFIVNH